MYRSSSISCHCKGRGTLARVFCLSLITDSVVYSAQFSDRQFYCSDLAVRMDSTDNGVVFSFNKSSSPAYTCTTTTWSKICRLQPEPGFCAFTLKAPAPGQNPLIRPTGRLTSISALLDDSARKLKVISTRQNINDKHDISWHSTWFSKQTTNNGTRITTQQ